MCGGGGESRPGRFILPPTWVLCLIFFNAHLTCFKLSVHEVVSFIIIIQVKLNCFVCGLVTNPLLQGLGGGKLSRVVYLAPHLGIMFNCFNAQPHLFQTFCT